MTVQRLVLILIVAPVLALTLIWFSLSVQPDVFQPDLTFCNRPDTECMGEP